MQEKFNITHGLDGSVVNYTVVYTDTVSQVTCYSITFPTSACGSYGICKHVLKNLPLSNCPSSIGIRVSVFGTNVLGRGSSNNFTVGRCRKIIAAMHVCNDRCIIFNLGRS